MWNEKILEAYNRSWIEGIKDKVLEFTHKSAKEILNHLKNKCLALTNTEKKEQLK